MTPLKYVPQRNLLSLLRVNSQKKSQEEIVYEKKGISFLTFFRGIITRLFLMCYIHFFAKRSHRL